MIKTFFWGFFREIKGLWQDKRMLFMFLIAPIALSMVVCGAFGGHVVNHIPLATVEESSSAVTRALVDAFDQSDRFDVPYVLTDREDAMNLMKQGEVAGVIVIPEDYTRALQQGRQAEVLVGIDSSNNIVGNSAVVSIMQVVKTVSSQTAVKSLVAGGSSIVDGTAKVMPISTILRPWFNPQFSYLTYLGLGLVGLIFHQTFVMTVATAFAEEKKNGILTGKTHPRDCVIFFVNKVLFYSITGFLVLLVNYYFVMDTFGFPMKGNEGDFVLLCGYFTLSLTGAGALLGILCKNTIHAIQWLMAMTYPLFILSGFSWPHSEMPDFLVSAAQVFPTTHFMTPIRNIALTGMGMDTPSLAYSRDMLLFLGVAMLCLSMLFFGWKVYRTHRKEKAIGKEATA